MKNLKLIIMRISKAISIIETFAGDEKLLIKRNNVEELKRISQEFNDKLPRDLKDYIHNIMPTLMIFVMKR